MRKHKFLAQICVRVLTAIAVLTITGFILVGLTVHTQAQNGQTRLLRTPTVSATQIAFAYANNIWVVPRAGGMARRLTSFQGQTSNPHFSPDGKWLAFGAERGASLLDRARGRRSRRAAGAASRVSRQDLTRWQAHRLPHEHLVGRGA